MTTPVSPKWLFGSLFIGGFECSNQLTLDGNRLDMIAASQHDRQAAADYALCRSVGMRAVREAARWPLIDSGGQLKNLTSVREMAQIGRKAGLTQIWDLMHYGYPDDLDPTAADFVPRFAAYARAVAQAVREESVGQTYFTPVNEISYYAFAGGEIAYMAPFWQHRGGDLKRILVQAAIAAANAIWEVDPEAQMVSVDPLVHLHPPTGRPDLQADADFFNQYVVTEGFDMLAGGVAPELGGSRRHLGIIGLNFYASNQWTIATPEQPQRFLELDDPAWLPLSDMLVELQARYGGPIILAETGASGEARAPWVRYLAAEVKTALDKGVDFQGICFYPTITTPDWEDPTAFFDGGIFDVHPQPDGTLARALSLPVAQAIHDLQQQLDPANALALPQMPSDEPQANIPAQVITPLEQVRFRADNFSYQTLLAGEQLTVELYGFEPGGSLPTHRHLGSEQVWIVLQGGGEATIGESCFELQQGQTLLIPAGLYHSIYNNRTERLVIQQITAPKLWDARRSAE